MSEHNNPGPGKEPGDWVDWDRYEAEVNDKAAEPRVLVDSPQAQRVPGKITAAGLRAAERVPLLPAWAHSWADFRDLARWTLGHAAHTIAYHALRVPKYAARLALRAPRGVSRLVGGFTRWVLDMEGEPLRQVCARREDPETYLKLSRQRDARVRWRGIVAVPAVAVVIGLIVVVALMRPPAKWVAIAAITTGLGIVGRRADRPILDTAVMVPKVAKLTSDVVVRALSVLGLKGIGLALAKNPDAISFAAPITRDGPGWRADIDLPYGVTAAEVMGRRDKLASGLGRPLGCVWPEGDRTVSPARLVLWVGDQDMAAAKPAPWPLAKSGKVDLFKPFAFGTDPRGRPVTVTLPGTNALIGALPGIGKTVAARNVALAAALDPRAELWISDHKGAGDFDPLAQVAARYATGPDDAAIEQTVQNLRDLLKELERRAKVIAELPRSICPSSEVTSELASMKQHRLHPLVCLIDECHEVFTHPIWGKEAGELAEKIIRRGRAFAVILLLATQRPDSRNLPTGVSANAGTRFCLRVMDQTANDMILGTSAYKNGIRATMFTDHDKGVGWLVGPGHEPQIVRSYHVTTADAEKIAARARGLREAAGTIIGHAAGQPAQQAKRAASALLDDLLAVMPADEAKAWNDTLAGRLADHDPATYDKWTGEQLTHALKPFGVTTGQVWGKDADSGKRTNRRGIARAAVTKAVAHRQAQRRQPPPDGTASGTATGASDSSASGPGEVSD